MKTIIFTYDTKTSRMAIDSYLERVRKDVFIHRASGEVVPVDLSNKFYRLQELQKRIAANSLHFHMKEFDTHRELLEEAIYILQPKEPLLDFLCRKIKRVFTGE